MNSYQYKKRNNPISKLKVDIKKLNFNIDEQYVESCRNNSQNNIYYEPIEQINIIPGSNLCSVNSQYFF